MIRRSLTDQQLDMGPVTIRAFRSLTKDHVAIVAKALTALPAEWSMDVHDDYDGYLSIIVQPIDPSAPTVLLSGTTDRIELCTLDHDDDVQHRGSFSTIEAAAGELANLLSETP